MASNGSCCIVTWTIFKNHFLEVGLTQNRETMIILLQSLRVWDVYVCLRATSPPTRLRPVTIKLQELSLVEKAEPVQVRFALRLRDQLSMWMQDGCKVYMDSYMASNGSCFMVTWTIFKTPFLEVGLTQNRETMAILLQSLRVWDVYVSKGHFIHETESPWPLHFKNSYWWKRWSRSKFASHYTWETDIVCECKMDAKSTWIPTWHRMDNVSWSFGLFSKTTSWR